MPAPEEATVCNAVAARPEVWASTVYVATGFPPKNIELPEMAPALTTEFPEIKVAFIRPVAEIVAPEIAVPLRLATFNWVNVAAEGRTYWVPDTMMA